MPIPFAPFRPDVCQLDANVTNHTKGVLPGPDCLQPFKSFEAAGATATDFGEAVLNGFWARRADGTQMIVAGGDTTLKIAKASLSNTIAWVNLTPAAGNYDVPDNGFWQFKLFGPTLVAVNGSDKAQTYNINTSSITGSFSELNQTLSSSMGLKYVDIVGDFLVLANDTPNSKTNLVKWSEINNPLDWDLDTNSSGEQRLPDGGDITGLTTGRVSGHVLCENSIWRMTYTGGDEVFRFDQIENEVGARYPYAWATLWDVDYFLSARGFMRLNRDETLTPIGFGKVDNFFFGDVSSTDIVKTRGFAHPRSYQVWFLYWTSANGTSYADKALVHHVLTEEWRVVEMNHSSLLSFISVTDAPELDQLSGIYGNDIDNPGFYGPAGLLASFDTQALQSTTIQFGGFDSNNALGSFTGVNKAAEIETGEFQLTPGGRSFVQNVHPIIEGTNAMTVRVDKRDLIGDSWTEGADVDTETTTGDAPQRVTGRFHKARVKIPAGTNWSGAHGIVTPQFRPDGRR